ncbi:MAG: hypothetical protein ACRDQG_15470, partial [Pseudonocardiaceae bacterium]
MAAAQATYGRQGAAARPAGSPTLTPAHVLQRARLRTAEAARVPTQRRSPEPHTARTPQQVAAADQARAA